MAADEVDPLLQRILSDIDADTAERKGRKAKGRTKARRRAGGAAALELRSKGRTKLTTALESALGRVGRVERATHGFHTYPAGLHPLAAADIIAACPGPVHDPFCGGGTVLVEAALAGRSASGTDLSPIAVMVARTRTSRRDMASPMRSAARKLTEQARLRVDVEVPEDAATWYEPHVAQELGRLRDGIAEIEDGELREMLAVVFSSIVVKVSFRESDTRNSRVTHHRAPGTTAVLFHKKARELGRMLEQMPEAPDVRIRVSNAEDVGPPQGTRLVLTSPPYPGVYDYLPMQQLRHLWLGIDPSPAMRFELGSRRSFRALGRAKALQVWRQHHAAWISRQVESLETGARLAIVVGDGLVGDKPVDTLSPTADAMQEAGLELVARSSADRMDHARGAIRTEHILMGQVP